MCSFDVTGSEKTLLVTLYDLCRIGQFTVHRVYYDDQSLGRNGKMTEKNWLYYVVNLPMVTYVSTKPHLVTPKRLNTEFGLFHSWPRFVDRSSNPR